MEFAGKFEGQTRALGNRVTLDVGERPGKDVKGIPGDVAWYAYACSQCGYCVDQCDQFYGRGWESQSPRGKWYWLREYMAGGEKWTRSMVRHLPRLHDLRALRPPLLGGPADRALAG